MITLNLFDTLSSDWTIDQVCKILYNPKQLHSTRVNLNFQQSTGYISSVQDIVSIAHPKTINNRSDKKNKNNKHLLIDRLDLRKYKTKLIKSRTQIQINDDDDLSSDYSKAVKTNPDIDASLIRSLKQVKIKKASKTYLDRKSLSLHNKLTSLVNEQKSIQYISPNQIYIRNSVSIHEIAHALSIPETEIIKYLFLKGMLITINTIIDVDTAKLVAENYGFLVNTRIIENHNHDSVETYIDKTNLSSCRKRAPIVTVLGHVDHGKTTLLDTICSTNISTTERGGITQLVSAYEVTIDHNAHPEKIIFLDTPGHEAFSSMRSIGTQVTDIAIVVIAADDGLKEQSMEAIKQLQNNNISYIIAINKVDKPNINIVKVKEELAQLQVVDQKNGGDIPIIEVSALMKQNIDTLLHAIITLANAKKLIANPLAMASGTILDSRLHHTKGPIANILVQNGTLKLGDILMTSNSVSKIRVIISRGTIKVNQASSSSVVEVWGMSSVLESGDSFKIVKNDKVLKKKLNYNFLQQNKKSDCYLSFNNRKNVQDFHNTKQVNLILKMETQASIKVILKALNDIPQKKVRINIISIGIGKITSNDIIFASVSNSVIVGFNNSLLINIKSEAEKYNISVNNFNVIYDLLAYIKEIMIKLVDIEYTENIIGKAIVESIFTVSKGFAAGCIVLSGKLKKNDYIRVIRKDSIAYNGKLDSLKKVKSEVSEVIYGNECGVLSENFSLWQKKDIIEAYELIPKSREL